MLPAIFKRLDIRNELFALSFANNSGKTASENFEAPKRAFCDITIKRKLNFNWVSDLKCGEIAVKDLSFVSTQVAQTKTWRTFVNLSVKTHEAQSNPVITTSVYATPHI